MCRNQNGQQSGISNASETKYTSKVNAVVEKPNINADKPPESGKAFCVIHMLQCLMQEPK
jgi:hypothetical protein